MKLTNEQIREIAFGFLQAEADKTGVNFYRMPKTHAESIHVFNQDFGMKAYATAGVRLDFYTDSEFFAFTYGNAQKASSRNWYYFDLLVNGEKIALIGEENATACEGGYRIELPAGRNRVTLAFPNLFRAKIKSVELSDGATIEPFLPKRRVLFHGDSITHGYDSKHPADCYANRVALARDWEIFNHAIGGAFFDPRMIDETAYPIDCVCVACGTNDWRHRTKEELERDCKGFFEKLRRLYKTQDLCVILPIWRHDHQQTYQAGDFQQAKRTIAEIAQAYGANAVIDLWEDIPQELALFTDGLHPNDDGFAYYANGVLKALKHYGF